MLTGEQNMSNQLLTPTRIYLDRPNTNNIHPTFQNQLMPKIDFGSSELRHLFEQHEEELWDIVYHESFEYLNDRNLCNDDEGMFPRKSRLSGEYYLCCIAFDDYSFCSIALNFLGRLLDTKDDYLGLEIVFIYDVAQEKFFVRGINSACI